MAFTQPLEHSRRVRACCFSSPHAPGWEAPIPETWDKGRHPLGGWFRVLVMACGGVQEAGRVAGGETRRSEPVAPCCLSWSRTAALFLGKLYLTGSHVSLYSHHPGGLGDQERPQPREAPGLGRREVAVGDMTSGYILPLYPHMVSLLLVAPFSRNFCWSL